MMMVMMSDADREVCRVRSDGDDNDRFQARLVARVETALAIRRRGL